MTPAASTPAHERAADRNLALLKTTAARMGKMREQVMFLGGTVLPLLLSEPRAGDIRVAKDVDVMIHVPSKAHLWDFEDRMSDLGFRKMKTGATCHWIHGTVHLDVLTTEPHSVDFINNWGVEAVQQAQRYDIGDGMVVNVVRPSHYIAIKIDAFYRRGNGSYETSVDIYDILLVVRGCRDLETDLAHRASPELRAHLAIELAKLLSAGDDWMRRTATVDPTDRFVCQWKPDAIERMQRLAGRV